MASGSREKDPAPNPLIHITVHPPSHAIFRRDWPLYLPCEAIYTGSESSRDEDDAKREKMRDTHFIDLKSDAGMSSNDLSDENEVHKRDVQSATDPKEPIISYKWLHNDELIHLNDETRIFSNGTLRLAHSPTASGSYRCMVTTTVPWPEAVLSTATHVQLPGKFVVECFCRLNFNNAFAIRSQCSIDRLRLRQANTQSPPAIVLSSIVHTTVFQRQS